MSMGRYIITIRSLKQICVHADSDTEAGLRAIMHHDEAWDIDAYHIEDCIEITGDYDIGFIPEVVV